MPKDIETEYQDVLQNIEAAIIAVYRHHPELTDYSVSEALDVVTRAYEAEKRGRAAPARKLPPLDQQVSDAVKQVCDWRLGRAALTSEAGKKIDLIDEALTLDEIIACLKRIEKSVKKWNKSHGRRGYLDFVKRFV